MEGHVQAFQYSGVVPATILYDNTKLALAKILGDGELQRIIAVLNSQPAPQSK